MSARFRTSTATDPRTSPVQMPEHERKQCSRCGGPFTCMVGRIAECRCSTVKLNGDQRQYIAERFEDCLCAACIVEERRTYNIDRFNQRIKRLVGR